MVAGVNGGQECVRMIGISHRGFEVDEAVENAAGADPFVYGLADGFAVFGVVAGAVIRGEGAADDCDAVGVGAHDHLVEGGDQVGCGEAGIGRAMQAADVIDAFENEKILRSALGKHIAIEARQSTGAGSIQQDLVSADALVQYRQVAILRVGLQTPCKLIRPALVGVDG